MLVKGQMHMCNIKANTLWDKTTINKQIKEDQYLQLFLAKYWVCNKAKI